jgi:hypothetical protein
MLLDSLGIYGPNVGIILRTEPCKNAAACCVATHASFREALLEVSNRQYRNEGKVKTIDVAELYFKVKDFLEDFDPNNRADLHR